jgi:hypothetical protein
VSRRQCLRAIVFSSRRQCLRAIVFSSEIMTFLLRSREGAVCVVLRGPTRDGDLTGLLGSPGCVPFACVRVGGAPRAVAKNQCDDRANAAWLWARVVCACIVFRSVQRLHEASSVPCALLSAQAGLEPALDVSEHMRRVGVAEQVVEGVVEEDNFALASGCADPLCTRARDAAGVRRSRVGRRAGLWARGAGCTLRKFSAPRTGVITSLRPWM